VTTKNAVVTGANSGIGLETARGLARAGYHVVLVCRNVQRATEAKADIDATVDRASTEVVLADLGLQSDVRRAASEIEQRLERLDLLVNNAGIAVRKKERTAEGHEVMLAVNHLGPFLLTSLLLPMLTASAPSRIVNVASNAHKFGKLHLDDLERANRGYGVMGVARYGETKLMNILFTRELARRIAGTGVTVNAVHPGTVNTKLIDVPRPFSGIVRRIIKTPEQGAATSVFVATDPSLDGVSGGYFADSKRADGTLNRAAQDDDFARALWDRSETLVGSSAS